MNTNNNNDTCSINAYVCYLYESVRHLYSPVSEVEKGEVNIIFQKELFKKAHIHIFLFISIIYLFIIFIYIYIHIYFNEQLYIFTSKKDIMPLFEMSKYSLVQTIKALF